MAEGWWSGADGKRRLIDASAGPIAGDEAAFFCGLFRPSCAPAKMLRQSAPKHVPVECSNHIA